MFSNIYVCLFSFIYASLYNTIIVRIYKDKIFYSTIQSYININKIEKGEIFMQLKLNYTNIRDYYIRANK